MHRRPANLLKTLRGDGPKRTDDGVPPGAWSVSFAVAQVERSLVTLGAMVVVGEVTDAKVWRDDTVYFSLRDHGAVLPCRLRPGRAGAASLVEGARVVVTGRMGVNRRQGRMSLDVQDVTPVGRGALLEALEKLRERLAAEGLFDVDRKRPMPRLPQRVGVVTSLQGAALRDVVQVARSRCPGVSILVAPTRVQGEGASKEIARALLALDATDLCDVILVTRGGGSLEDLASFSMEVVVRAIASCRVPVVSAVGHETDTGLSDFVADVRAATPSHAAELAVPDVRGLQAEVSTLAGRAHAAWSARRAHAHARLARLERRLPTPAVVLGARRHRLVLLAQRLERALRQRRAQAETSVRLLRNRLDDRRPDVQLRRQAAALSSLERRLQMASPTTRIAADRAHLHATLRTLQNNVRQRQADARGAVATLARALDALSPLAVLVRGYTLVQRIDGTLVKRGAALALHDPLAIRFADGEVEVQVTRALTDEASSDTATRTEQKDGPP